MDFAIGVLVGILMTVVCGLSSWPASTRYDQARIGKIEQKTEKLFRHFACGQGYVGCNGGQRCSSDHK